MSFTSEWYADPPRLRPNPKAAPPYYGGGSGLIRAGGTQTPRGHPTPRHRKVVRCFRHQVLVRMTLRLYSALGYSQNSARDLRCALNGA